MDSPGNRLKPTQRDHVVEVGHALGALRSEVGNGYLRADNQRGLVRLGDAGITLGACIIVSADDPGKVG